MLLLAASSGAASGLVGSFLLWSAGRADPLGVSVSMGASIIGAVLAVEVVSAVLGRRLGRLLRRFGRERATTVETAGDLGKVLEAVDRLLAQAEVSSEGPGFTEATSRDASAKLATEGSAHPPVESRLEASEATQSAHDLDLRRVIALKTEELERRLRERALLFEILRESASSLDLERVLERLASRLGPALELRELAVLLREPDGSYRVRACWGFAVPAAVMGRSLEVGRGVTSASTASGKPVVIEDVSSAPDYLAFWDEVPRTGSFMSVPIRLRDEVIGAIALTRPPEHPLTDHEMRFLCALADQVALSIHNAQLFARVEVLSMTDELTKLPNRRYLNQALSLEIAIAHRHGHPLSILMVDIDHFKKLNDRAGHPIGDEALLRVAECLKGSLRESDVVARWGGEEFVVLLPHTAQSEAVEVAEKVRRAVAAIETPWSREQPSGHLTVSVGVAQLAPGEDGAALVQRADRAVYAAKREGRDRVSLPPRASSPG